MEEKKSKDHEPSHPWAHEDHKDFDWDKEREIQKRDHLWFENETERKERERSILP